MTAQRAVVRSLASARESVADWQTLEMASGGRRFFSSDLTQKQVLSRDNEATTWPGKLVPASLFPELRTASKGWDFSFSVCRVAL